MLRSLVIFIMQKLRGNSVHISTRVQGSGAIDLGGNVKLMPGVVLDTSKGGEVRIGRGSTVMHGSILDTRDRFVHIGENCTLGAYSVLQGHGGITVGDDSIIGPLACFVSVEHNYADPDTPIRLQGWTRKGITIEENVWLGARVTVLDGVTVGRGSVIGAGSVVTKDVPEYSVALGVPARVVKKIK